MTGGEGSAVMRPALAPVFAPDGVATELAERPTAGPDALRLTDKLRAYDPKANVELIDAAYTVARQAHGVQLRDNGEPYITHPVAVGDILAGYRLDTASIATGPLHDVIDDTPVKLPEIQTRFRGGIAGLADGFTNV